MAQQTVNYASASGRVTDPSAALIAGATVTARETETGIRSTSTTDSEGRFRFPYLKPGPYEIEVRATGFGTLSRSINLTLGATVDLALQLTVANVETKVTVNAEPAVIESTRTQIAGTVTQTEMRALPTNGRS